MTNVFINTDPKTGVKVNLNPETIVGIDLNPKTVVKIDIDPRTNVKLNVIFDEVLYMLFDLAGNPITTIDNNSGISLNPPSQ